jgi:AcrR family transcriptional regulator
MARQMRVLDAARRVFERQGIERTTVDDVLQEGGMARATFYRAFASLDEVIETLYAHYEQGVMQRLLTDLERMTSGTDLSIAVESVLTEHIHQGPLIRAMFREELRPGRGVSRNERIEKQVEAIAGWWERTAPSPPDRGQILCLVLLLQGAGLYSGDLDEPARASLRSALVAAMSAIVTAHQRAHQEP